MRRIFHWSIVVALLLLAAHRSPAPIHEEPAVTPSQSTEPAPPVQAKSESKSVPTETPQQNNSTLPVKAKKTQRLAARTANNNVTPPPPAAANIAPADWQRFVISSPDVVFPEVVKRTGMQGQGLFQLTVDPKDGTVTEVKVLRHTGYDQLDRIFVSNFFQWRFQPRTITTAKIPRGIRVTGQTRFRH